jgi:uncharacterized protein
MTDARASADRNGDTHARRPPGTPCWVSLMTHALATTEEFYGALFGWEFTEGPRQPGPSLRARLDGHDVAGIGQLPADRHLTVSWTPYLASDDVDLTAETVRLCGGTIGVGPLDAADTGRMAIGSDPAGAVFGIFQAARHLDTAIAGGPGAPVWNELVTYETESVAKFYGTVFGYQEEAVEVPGSDFLALAVDGRPVAGIHGVGDAVPRDRGPYWMTYFEVADADKSLRQVTDLGGRVLGPAHDSPHGRVATVADPEGAVFSVIQDPC